jgi:hypothetical protein
LPRGAVNRELSTGDAGPESGEVLRTYTDGFVGPDTAGTTSGSLFENTTSRFGFENDSQNNANTTLVFQAPLTGENAFSSSSSQGMDLSWEDEADRETGAIIELGLRVSPEDQALHVSGLFAVLLSSFELQGGGSTFEANRRDTVEEIGGTLTDTYQVPSGVILPLAPYSQPSANPPPGFYPRIQDEPTRVLAPEVINSSTRTMNWFNRIDESVEADVITFSFGPEVQLALSDIGFVALSAGAALHVVDWNATHEETLYRRDNSSQPQTVQRWEDSTSNTDTVWGGFTQISAGVHLSPDESSSVYILKAFARWDMADDVEGQVGPSTFTLDLDAFSAGAVAGFLF